MSTLTSEIPGPSAKSQRVPPGTVLICVCALPLSEVKMPSLTFFFLSGSCWCYFLIVSFPSFPVLVFWMYHPPSLTDFSIFVGYCCCYFVYSEFTTWSELGISPSWFVCCICLSQRWTFLLCLLYNTSLLFHNLRD